MKKILMSAAAAAMIFASCSKETGGGEVPDAGSATGTAYVSIRVESQPVGRAGSSTEAEDTSRPEESDTKSLYLITFTDAGNVVAVPDQTDRFYTEILTPDGDKTPDAVKISASSKKLVLIANPGTKLKAAITGLRSSSAFATFNAAITAATTADIVDGTKGFAMISAGDDAGKAVGAKILDPYVVIGNYLKVVEGTDLAAAEAAAKSAANTSPLPVKLERYAAKLMVKKDDVVTVKDEGQFELTDWTVDAVNGSYYPFAEKTLIAGHTAGNYTQAFYTKDPNYTNNSGIVYGTVDANFAQVLPDTWKVPATGVAYVIENTMDAGSQTIANATRIVMKATYSPKTYTVGDDWFACEGTTYQTLAALQEAYEKEDATTTLITACNHFYDRIENYYTVKGLTTLAAADFKALTEAELAAVAPGGEVVKGGASTPSTVILWYKDAVCYYHYEIRHDNDPYAGNMAFAKYGVVRNNWYNLKLNSVSGPGTPWYPDINKPGPGDPDPKDPIDKQAGYLGVEITINKWIFMDTPFGI